MKTFKQKQASNVVFEKYPYKAFLIHKEQKHTDALVERIANETKCVSPDFVLLRLYAYIRADLYMVAFSDGNLHIVLLDGRIYSFTPCFRSCKCDGNLLWHSDVPSKAVTRRLVKLLLKINGNILVGF